ncbi:MAG: DUF805 domain-containing protein [Alistipes sp.]|nr:DUF805 domain-containing protein [Alistipes sp.]
MNWYLKVVKEHYADFKGRARRREYWMFVLFNLLFAVAAALVGAMIRFPFLSTLYGLAVLVPSIAVGVRRLHDLGKSGWMLLLCLIPLVNLYLIYLFCLEGEKKSNAWGPNSKASE